MSLCQLVIDDIHKEFIRYWFISNVFEPIFFFFFLHYFYYYLYFLFINVLSNQSNFGYIYFRFKELCYIEAGDLINIHNFLLSLNNIVDNKFCRVQISCGLYFNFIILFFFFFALFLWLLHSIKLWCRKVGCT